jgi:hypothetical protein
MNLHGLTAIFVYGFNFLIVISDEVLTCLTSTVIEANGEIGLGHDHHLCPIIFFIFNSPTISHLIPQVI